MSLTIVAAHASAQGDMSFDGTWRMTVLFPGAKNPIFGSVELHGSSGTWMLFSRTAAQMFENPCIGRPFPVTVEESQPEAVLTFRVDEAEVVRGCTLVTASFVPLSANKLEGRMWGSVPIFLERD